MSYLKPGTLCVIIGGCPENIGLIVEVMEQLGPYGNRADAYSIKTVSGRYFAQLWGAPDEPVRGHTSECITDRHKLRPLVDPNEKTMSKSCEIDHSKSRHRTLAAQNS